MQDSGNKWLGQIPAHWELVYLWQVCSEQSNKNKELTETNVLSLSHGNIIRKKDINYGLVPKGYDGYQIVDPG
jgi:type I restriction enzyme S subunit